MPEFQRYFSLNARVAISGIALTTRTGPVIETWNRRHDRNAGLCMAQRYCDGVLLAPQESYREGTYWTLDFLMTGPLANDEHVAQFTALALEAICTPPYRQSPPLLTESAQVV